MVAISTEYEIGRIIIVMTLLDDLNSTERTPWRNSDLALAGRSCQESVQIIGKLLFVSLAEGRRAAAHFDSAGSHRVEKIPHIKACANIFLGMHFTARAQCVATFFDYLRRERDVTGDDEIAFLYSFYDFIVGHIKSLLYLDGFDVR